MATATLPGQRALITKILKYSRCKSELAVPPSESQRTRERASPMTKRRHEVLPTKPAITHRVYKQRARSRAMMAVNLVEVCVCGSALLFRSVRARAIGVKHSTRSVASFAAVRSNRSNLPAGSCYVNRIDAPVARLSRRVAFVVNGFVSCSPAPLRVCSAQRVSMFPGYA